MTKPPDAVKEFLRKNKYPPHLVKEGGAGLVRRWKEFIEQVEKGYSLGLEDYRNDLDIRSILQRAGAVDAEVTLLDERLKRMLTAKSSEVWESECGDVFWCRGYPKNAGDELMRDLRKEGIKKR